jgi:hypothetical protein
VGVGSRAPRRGDAAGRARCKWARSRKRRNCKRACRRQRHGRSRRLDWVPAGRLPPRCMERPHLCIRLDSAAGARPCRRTAHLRRRNRRASPARTQQTLVAPATDIADGLDRIGEITRCGV